MTDKVQKIREEVERLHKEYRRKKGAFYYRKALRAVLYLIDSLQEKPVSIWHDASEKPERDDLLIETNDGRIIHRHSINNYGMVKRWAYTSALLNLDNSCNLGNNSQEEPVSEELEEAAYQFVMDNFGNPKESLYKFDQRCFKAGAEWQKEQFEKNRLEHCNSITEEQYNLEVGFIDQHLDKYNRMPTFLDAIEYGMRLQKEQMMKDANDVIVKNLDSLSYMDCLVKLKCVDKDIVKVICVKEE